MVVRRARVEVRYRKTEARWFVLVGVEVKGWKHVKKDAVKLARRVAKRHQPSELFIFNKNGKLGKGHDSRATYGSDPKRRKG